MTTILQDARYGLRQLRAAPAFTATALLSLALGIGAAVTMFSAFRAVFLAQLPYRDPSQLVDIGKLGPHDRTILTTAADMRFLRQYAASLSSLAGYGNFESRTITGAGDPVNLIVNQVSGELFPLLGTTPMLGRPITAVDIRPGAPNTMVLSYKTWQSLFGGEANVLGRQVYLNRETFTIAGVMPPSFQFPRPQIQAWIPDRTPITDPYQSGSPLVARLKPGVSVEQAHAEIERLAPALKAAYPASGREWSITVAAILGRDSATFRTPFELLLGAVALLLLIACLNVSNLLLARASAREAEFAVRSALGASRARLFVQTLTESMVLAGLGGILGTALAYGGNRLLIHLLPVAIGVPRLEQSNLDGEVLLIAIALAAWTGLLFGIIPAQVLSGRALAQADRKLRVAGGQTRSHATLLAAEVALAFILLSGSVLMIRGFVRLSNVDPGFRTEHVLTAGVPPNRTGPPTQDQLAARYGAILEASRRVPGVEAAAVTSAVPLGRIGVAIDYKLPGSADEFRVQYHAVSSDYFAVMGIPLKRGRFFDARDTGSNSVAIINEAMARRYWPGQDPLGRPMGEHAITIVGIVGNTHLRDLSGELVPEFYEPYQQYFGPPPGATLVLRTAGDPISVISGLRRAIHDFDPEQVVENIKTLGDLVSNSESQSRFYTSLMLIFAFLAVTLTLIGVYGVASYSTNRRAREMGIRMAVGAEPGALVAMILRQGLLSVALGILAGLAGAWMLAQFIASMVYGVPARDPVSLAAASAVLALGALTAYFVPARRITRIDPAAILRHE